MVLLMALVVLGVGRLVNPLLLAYLFALGYVALGVYEGREPLPAEAERGALPLRKGCCPVQPLVFERRATPTAARDLLSISLAALVVVEEHPSVFSPANPPELSPDGHPLLARTT